MLRLRPLRLFELVPQIAVLTLAVKTLSQEAGFQHARAPDLDLGRTWSEPDLQCTVPLRRAFKLTMSTSNKQSKIDADLRLCSVKLCSIRSIGQRTLRSSSSNGQHNVAQHVRCTACGDQLDTSRQHACQAIHSWGIGILFASLRR